jgi:CheY-like chemotaxis protein
MVAEKILVVDDNPSNRKLLGLLLAGRGYDLRSAVDAEEALEILKVWRPHLVLMDVQLPGMDGLELTRRLKTSAETRDISVLVISASSDASDIQKAHAAGCDACVEKRFDTVRFPELVASMLASRADRGDPK